MKINKRPYLPNLIFNAENQQITNLETLAKPTLFLLNYAKKAPLLRRGFLYYLVIETLLKMRSIICLAVTPSASAS
ncbi:hypothetical protein SAMN05421780_102341 [Flexibacter flexilis DSM 6793]|uniref:Uncharacterized protein n=1 Tax=Flexibacter flexilis DSM 6793 TaxID=927664 RepID=A0A1I1G291_9BACT|nr:hypothetical protein SAMN05421780_102341 [Flexibacter flexilis DSM 6793]